MKIKVGDQVKILVGKDKGKEGKVVKTFRDINKVLIEGLNMAKKHSKPNNTNEKGGIFDIETPIHASNVKVIANATKPEKKAKVEKAPKVVKKPVAKKTEKKVS